MKEAENYTPVGKCYSYILAPGTAATAVTQNNTCTIAHTHTSLIMSRAPNATYQRGYLTSNKNFFGPGSGTKANTPHLVKHKKPPDVYKALSGRSTQMLFTMEALGITDHPADRARVAAARPSPALGTTPTSVPWSHHLLSPQPIQHICLQHCTNTHHPAKAAVRSCTHTHGCMYMLVSRRCCPCAAHPHGHHGKVRPLGLLHLHSS